MKDHFTMDAPQPRLLDEMKQGVIGKPMDRPDGPQKVSGTAGYAADHTTENMVHGVLVRARRSRATASGRSTRAASKQLTA